jgi:hypothetical protein
MNAYQIIIFILKMIAEQPCEYPPALLASRRAAFVNRVNQMSGHSGKRPDKQ